VFKSRLSLYLVAVLLGFVFVSLAIYYRPIISGDSTYYLHAANIFKAQGFAAASRVYAWPYYPVLLGVVSKSTGLSVLHAGYSLNYVFFVVSLLSFLLLIRELGGDLTHQWLGLFVILSYHYFVKFMAIRSLQ